MGVRFVVRVGRCCKKRWCEEVRENDEVRGEKGDLGAFGDI